MDEKPSVFETLRDCVSGIGMCAYETPLGHGVSKIMLATMTDLPLRLRLGSEKPDDAVRIKGERSGLLEAISRVSKAIRQIAIALLKKGFKLFFSEKAKSVWVDGLRFSLEPY